MADKIIPFNVALLAISKRYHATSRCYTNDLNSTVLQFTISDMTAEDLAAATGQVLIYAKDGSYFVGDPPQVSKAGTVFSYRMTEGQGNHPGVAKVQLVVTIGAQLFASQLYYLEIVSGLDNQVANEVMVQDWSTLIAALQEIIALTANSLGPFDIALENGIIAANIAAKLVELQTLYAPRLVTVEQDLDAAEVVLGQKADTAEVLNTNLIGANNDLVAQSVITDYFDRPNTTSGMGKNWTAALGTWGIIDGQAYVSTTAGLNRALIDTGSGDGEVEAIFATNAGLARIIFRHTDTNNEMVLYADDLSNSRYVLAKRVANVVTDIATYSTTPTHNAKVKVVFNGSAIQVYLNGFRIFDNVETANMTATKHGLGNSASTATRFKNFKFRTPEKIVYPTTLIASVDDMLVDYKFNTLFLSRDGGRTYSESLSIAEVPIIKFFHLFSDGSIMFASHTKLYYSHDWQTYHESALFNADGSPFTAIGQYDNFTTYKNNAVKKIINGVEMAVWGNYSTVAGVEFTDFMKVWYTKDKGITVKIGYSFNTPTTVPCRHIHNVDFNPSDGSIWVQTGDDAVNSHWVKGYYNPTTDIWTWSVFASGNNFKTTNMIFHSDGYAYWSWDNSPGGIVRAPIATMEQTATHELLFNTNKDCNNIFIGPSGDLVAFQTTWGGTEPPRIMYYSPDRVTFHRIVGDMPPAFDGLSDAQYQAHWAPNADGKILCGIQSLSQQPIIDWGRGPSTFIDDYIREYGFPNAFK